MSKNPSAFRNNAYFLKLVWEVSPKHILLSMACSLLGFASWVFYSVIFVKYLFGAAESNRTFTEITVFVLCSLIAMLLIAGLQGWFFHRFAPASNQQIHYALNRKLFDKASSVDVACYENPEFYDHYTKATTEVFTRALSVVENTSAVFGSLFASVTVIGLMFSINIWAGFFAFLPMLGNFVFGRVLNKIYYRRNNENVPYQRRQDYVNRAVYLQKFSKEIRLTNIFSVVRKTYEFAFQGICGVADRYGKKLFALESAKSILCFPLVFEGLWLFAAFSAMVTKTIQIGDFVVLASGIVSTTWMLDAFTKGLMESYNNGLYIENLKKFLHYEAAIPEDQEGRPVPESIETLEFQDVSFRYTGSDTEVLRHVSLTVAAGEAISLVGHNGAGKSTLIKLMMRLYDPTEGKILLNGVDIREFELKAYRSLIGTTFQDFQMLSMTVLENVIMGKVDSPEKRRQALDALRQSGVEEIVNRLPHGPDTILTREFDDEGAVLSGGQFQKIAVARAFAKRSPIVILDEPSSALDPVAEYEMYETIMKLCSSASGGQKKLSVLISHRLSSAARADRIYLLENGQVVEEGAHAALMEQNGAYADLFRKQAESYLQDEAV